MDERLLRWGTVIPASDPVKGRTERCIELPLALGILNDVPLDTWVLDAGCGFNVVALWGLQHRLLHVTLNLDLEPCRTGERRSYASMDFRRDLRLFRDHAFEQGLCISTLEHVGMDNSHYGGNEEHDLLAGRRALDEILRVCRHLFVTVPFKMGGTAQWRPWQEDDLVPLLARGGEARFYAKCDGGWFGGEEQPVAPLVDASPKPSQVVCVRL